jgi:regulator of RNase E activity RraB
MPPPSSRKQDWGLYPTEIDGTPAWVTAELSFAEEPDPMGRTTFVHIRFPLPDCNEEGLPQEKGLQRIEQIEDEVIPLMEERFKALHVGSMSHAKQRHLFFYTASDKGLSEALRPFAAMFPDSAPSAMSRPDPTGDMYTSLILPDDWQSEFIQNHRVCEALLSEGDNPEKERPIEHLALFTTELGRERFAGRARELGYRVKPAADAAEGEPDAEVFPIEFEHTGTTDPFDLTERTTILADEAMELDGEYDGWQAAPTK